MSHGAREVWIVCDKTQTVEWYGLGGASPTFRTLFQSPELDAEIDASEIFL